MNSEDDDITNRVTIIMNTVKKAGAEQTMSPEEEEKIARAVEQFFARADEAREMFLRARRTFPLNENKNVKEHAEALARRREKGDARVIKYGADPEGEFPEHYELAWTADEKNHLIEQYMAARDWTNWAGCDDDRHYQAELFVRILEGFGASIPTTVAIEPPPQKERQRKFDSVSNAFAKLVDSLNALDSAALGWLFSTVEEKAAEAGMTLRPSGPDVVSLKRLPFRAQVEAGELRAELGLLASTVGAAISQAGKSLPKADRDDPRLGIAFAIERQMFEHRIPFTTTDTGFAAECLRAVCDLGELDTERVSYWLKKADETPDDERPFHAVRKQWKTRQENGG